MTLQLVSEILFALGRRFPRLPFAFLRAMPLGLLHALRAPGLRATFRVAARASYYRDAFAAMRVDAARARRPEDLGDFYLTPGVLKTRPEALVTGTAELAIESSGTTGHATRVYLSRRELEYNARQGGLLYGLYGLGRGDRLLCTLDLAWGLGSLLVERGVRYTPLFAMVVGRVDPLEAYRHLAEYRFNVVVSDPFWLARLTAIARERGRPGPLKLLMGGGEGITARTRAELEAFWGAPLCMTYASTEAATILGFECTHRLGYHVNEFDFYLEIAHPDADGYGEIVLTTVNRRVMPLIRYRTGRSEEHTSELQSQSNLECRLLLEKKTDESADDSREHSCRRARERFAAHTSSKGRRGLPVDFRKRRARDVPVDTSGKIHHRKSGHS